MKTEITDRKIAARVRRLIRTEFAGYFDESNGRRDVCLEPGCSCGEGTCGPFRSPPTRCSMFERNVLGLDPQDLRRPAWGSLDPELAEAYRRHLLSGSEMRVRRCRWPRCRRELRGDVRRRYCETHATMSQRRAQREHKRRLRGEKLASGTRSSIGDFHRISSDPLPTPNPTVMEAEPSG